MNLNHLARKITLAEGKKVNLSIAQVKEVLRLLLLVVQKMSARDLVRFLSKIHKTKNK